MLVVEAMLSLAREDVRGNESDITKSHRGEHVILSDGNRKQVVLLSLRCVK